MTNKKNVSLGENLGNNKKYEIADLKNNPSVTPQQEHIDFNKLKDKLEDFKKKIIKKYPFTKSLGILPPAASLMFEEDENVPKEEAEKKPIHIIMLIPEDHFKELNKIKPEVVKFAKESGENLWIHIKTTEVDLWNYGLDSKYEFLDAISACFPLHDNGFLGALRVANIHKTLVLNWLNVGRVHYVASYGIFGSLVRGTADKTSDVDVFVIIDDTDVKRMSRIELLEKLRGKIVYEFAREATALAGVKNILNIQVYLLTDFWNSVKDAQPVMFTLIRDGVPMYDKGTFIPWKRLLQMGKIKPSAEAIDLYMKEGDRTEELVKRRLLDCMVDAYYGVVTPTQALMMMAGHAPPVPKTIVSEVKEILVNKEKVMSERELKVLEKAVKYFKNYEHGKLKEISGKEIDELMKESKEYAKRMKELREKLEKRMQEHQAEKINESAFALMKNIFGDKNQEQLIENLENEMIKKGKMQDRMLDIAKDLTKIKQKVKSKKLTSVEMQNFVRNASDLINGLMEYSQRKELVSAQRGIMQILYEKNNKAEIVATDNGTYVVEIDRIRKISDGKLIVVEKKELENALSNSKERLKYNLDVKVLDVLKKELGDFEVVF